jgi:hypothetical protein
MNQCQGHPPCSLGVGPVLRPLLLVHAPEVQDGQPGLRDQHRRQRGQHLQLAVACTEAVGWRRLVGCAEAD